MTLRATHRPLLCSRSPRHAVYRVRRAAAVSEPQFLGYCVYVCPICRFVRLARRHWPSVSVRPSFVAPGARTCGSRWRRRVCLGDTMRGTASAGVQACRSPENHAPGLPSHGEHVTRSACLRHQRNDPAARPSSSSNKSAHVSSPKQNFQVPHSLRPTLVAVGRSVPKAV